MKELESLCWKQPTICINYHYRLMESNLNFNSLFELKLNLKSVGFVVLELKSSRVDNLPKKTITKFNIDNLSKPDF